METSNRHLERGRRPRRRFDARVDGSLRTAARADGYPIVLVRLDRVTRDGLRDLIVDAWPARAPKRLVEAYVEASDEA